MKIYKFYPDNGTKFRFGERGEKINDLVSSDRLFSALCNCITLLYGNSQAAVKAIEFLTELNLSSLNYGMHIVNKTNNRTMELFFLPRPLGPIQPQDKDNQFFNYKRVKRINYLSLDAFCRVLQSWRSEEKYFAFDLSELQIIGRKFACTKEEADILGITTDELQRLSLFASLANPKVTVSRQNDHSERFYYQEEMEVTFEETEDYLVRPFVYFLCKGEIIPQIAAAVKLLAEEGLGGKRSSGMGCLGQVAEEEGFRQLAAEHGNYYVSLSSIYPSQEEVNNLIYYELVDRAGYLHSLFGRSLRKKGVRVLKEGTVLSGKIAGQLVEVGPAAFDRHPVYLYGKAFLVPVGRCGNEVYLGSNHTG